MEKAQIIGQVFIYILSILIIAAILIYGYSSISKFRQKSEEVSFIRLKSTLSTAINSISTQFGDIGRKELEMGEFLEICFIESFSPFNAVDRDNILNSPQLDPVLKDSILSTDNLAGDNVYLLKDTVEKKFKVDPLEIDGDVLCIPQRGQSVLLRFEGMGNRVKLSTWQTP